MASLLESQLRRTVASAFKGKLLKGVLRRAVVNSVDAYGDDVTASAQTYPFEGIVDSFNAFDLPPGCPSTDARILIIGGSVLIEPKQDDQVKMRDTWYQLRQLASVDTALAAYTFAGFVIPEPT